MGISVNSSSAGASRIRALDKVRLMELLERLPTKYPILKAMALFLPDAPPVAGELGYGGDRTGGPDPFREHSPASAG